MHTRSVNIKIEIIRFCELLNWFEHLNLAIDSLIEVPAHRNTFLHKATLTRRAAIE